MDDPLPRGFWLDPPPDPLTDLDVLPPGYFDEPGGSGGEHDNCDRDDAWVDVILTDLDSDVDPDSDSDDDGDPNFEAEPRTVDKHAGKRGRAKARAPLKSKEDKHTGKRGFYKTECNTRTRYSYRAKAVAVAYYDSLVNDRGKRKANRTITASQCLVKSGDTLHQWLSVSARAKIEAAVGEPIYNFAPGLTVRTQESAQLRKGGRGKKAPGKDMYSFSLCGRKCAKFAKSEAQLIVWCRDLRKKGTRLTPRMVQPQMRSFVRTHDADTPGASKFKASKGWMKRFMGRFGIVWRRRNDKASKSVEELISPLAAFINRVRKLRRLNPSSDDLVFGKYGLYNTLNVDQVPLPFASTDQRTLEFLGTKRCWIKQLGSGLDKRQCTLQLLIRPMGKQPKPCLIFRGPKVPTRAHLRRARAAEEEEYQKEGLGDVLVLWQPKAWADFDTCLEWTEKGLGEFVKSQDELKALPEGKSCLLLVDNLVGQVKQGFVEAAELNGKSAVMFGPPNATHLWQPVDHHIGARYKKKMGELYDDWMAKDGRFLKKISTPQRRIMLVKWAGQVYRELEAERESREQAEAEEPTQKASMFYQAFSSPGMLVVPAGTKGGPADTDIRPHADIVGKVRDEFFRLLALKSKPRNGKSPAEEEAEFIINLSDSESDDAASEDDEKGNSQGVDVDSEDEDDEEPDYADEDFDLRDDDDGKREDFDDRMSLDVPSEADLIKSAAKALGDDELRDFRCAHRVAQALPLMNSGVVQYEALPAVPNVSGHRRSTRKRTKQVTNP
jgi:hypothetical protein